MDFNWDLMLNDLAIIVCIVGSILIINNKWFHLFKANVRSEKQLELKEQEIEDRNNQFNSSPAGAIIVQALNFEVNQLTESYKKSEVWRLILIGLCSFKESPQKLNFTQRYALISYVVSTAPKEWGIEPQMISDILPEIERRLGTFSSQEIVKAANAFTIEYNKTNNPVSGSNPQERRTR
ncbi:hypothetical protein EHS13_08485 [Paenibacillus psychroresistens]|uniref:Uncharacterized protein n=1 Tax=Paenibacillus psychroresistens TaxID=1778678 RepID=A0A6B8RH89_9BACL|nr:hypothetical protein [Paenibacillus psychroresistens]QGQ94912.1 hypothetical protein EHS13_08485 [Paenibacillus psychroresistens]